MLASAAALDFSWRVPSSVSIGKGGSMSGVTRFVANVFAAACIVIGASQVIAQEFPTRPLRIIVPNSPGSAQDLIARIMGPELEKGIGQPVIIENRAGAGQVIGLEYVAKQAPADGHTLASVSVESLASLALVVKDLRFNPTQDLPPLVSLVEGRLFFGSSSRQPWTNFQEFVAHAKANPGRLNYGGSTAVVRLVSDLLIREMLGLDVVFIPYNATGPYDQALLAGDIHVGFSGGTFAMGSGSRYRPLAVTGRTRFPALGSTPSLGELGYPNIPGVSFSLNLRSGTPKPVVDKLYSAASRALQSPNVRAQLGRIQFEVVELNPEAAGKRLGELTTMFADVARKAGIQPQ